MSFKLKWSEFKWDKFEKEVDYTFYKVNYPNYLNNVLKLLNYLVKLGLICLDFYLLSDIKESQTIKIWIENIRKKQDIHIPLIVI